MLRSRSSSPRSQAKTASARPAGRLPAFLRFGDPETPSEHWRVFRLERNIVLPTKAVLLCILFYYLFFTNWMEETPVGFREAFGESPWRMAQRAVEYGFLFYAALNVATAFVLMGSRELSTRVLLSLLFLNALLDATFLGGMVLVTEGVHSSLFWVFPLLIARNTLILSPLVPQLILNLSTCGIYAAAAAGAAAIERADALAVAGGGSAAEAVPPGLDLGWPFGLRVLLLGVVSLWLLGLRVLLERQQRQAEEQAEMLLRKEQIEATARLAAEIAHKLKNPLAIINNASYTLQRTVKEGKGTITQQIQIIREEIERSDRLITELMGFAQLAEGQVERVDVREEIERAIRQVFPPAVKYDIQIYRDYGAGVPPLTIQRNHLGDALVNILTNAREMMQGRGHIWISTRMGADQMVRIRITDDGPGIAPENLGRIFEPYFTTRAKGSGLGLAIVKHNLSIYGGDVTVESEVGRGASFTLSFPVKSTMRLRK